MNPLRFFNPDTYARRMILPALALAASLFAVTCFLFYDACVLGAKKASLDVTVKLGPLKGYGSDSCIGLIAQSPRGSSLCLFVGNRRYAGSLWGEMELPYDKIPKVADNIRFVAFSDDGRVIGEKDTVFKWPEGMFPVRVDIAAALGQAGLWVAGTAAPGQQLSVKTSGGKILGWTRAGSGGLFSMVGPMDSVRATDSIRVISWNNRGCSDTARGALSALSTAFSRAVVFECANADTLDKYANAIDSLFRADHSLKAMGKFPQALSSVRISMELPACYGGIEAVQRGSMSPEEFLEKTAGDVRRIFFEPGRDDPAKCRPDKETILAPRVAVVTGGRSTRVTIEKKFLMTGGRLGLYGEAAGGLSSTFLRLNDTLTIILNGHRAEKIIGRLPDSSIGAKIVWTGKPGQRQPGGEYGAMALLAYRLGFSGSGANPADNNASDSTLTNIKGFIRNYEANASGGLAASLMKLLVWIVIFSAFIHFSRIRRKQGHASGEVVGALSTIFLVWGILFFGQQCLPAFVWVWIRSLLVAVIGNDGHGFAAAYLTRSFSEKSDSAALDSYAFVCLALFILLPFYFRKMQLAFARQSGDTAIKNRGWGAALRIGWLTLMCALALIAANGENKRPFAAPIARFAKHTAVTAQPGADSVWSKAINLFPTAALPLAAAALGPEALLFAAGQSVVSAYGADAREKSYPAFFLSAARAVQGLPWWCIAGIAALCCAPLLRRLLVRVCAVADTRRKWLWSLGALGASALIMSVEFLPQQFAMHGAAFGAAMGLAWLIVHLVRKTEPRIERFMSGVMGVFIYVVIGVAALYLSSPVAAPGTTVRWSLYSAWPFAWLLSDVLLYCAGLAVILHLLARLREQDRHIHHDDTLMEGVFLFAALLTGLTTWMGIPVPLLVALIVPFAWLFRSKADMKGLATEIDAHGGDMDKVVSQSLRRLIATVRYNNIVSALRGQFEKAAITPDEFERKRKEYSQSFFSADEPGDNDEEQRRRELLSIGTGGAWENVRSALRAGMVLAAIPLAMSLISELPSRWVQYPFPLADFMIFIALASMRYLLYAFVFGFFYAHIRGRTGLTKGAIFAFAVIAPFAAYQLIAIRELAELRAFATWAGQIFLFCSLLGLWVGDVRLLRKNGYAIKDLLYLHNVPMLSAYTSAVAAAIGAAVISVVSGSAQDLTKFFISTVINR